MLFRKKFGKIKNILIKIMEYFIKVSENNKNKRNSKANFEKL
jgi:hypothetical protein